MQDLSCQAVLSLDVPRAHAVPELQLYSISCQNVETPSFQMKIVSPEDNVCLLHILANPSSSWCIHASFERLVQHRFAVPTCSTGTYRSSGIAEVVADWASWLLGPTLLRHSHLYPRQKALQEVLQSVRSFASQPPKKHSRAAVALRPLLMGEQVDLESISEVLGSVWLNPAHYVARIGSGPKGLDCMTSGGPACFELHQAWQLCVKLADNIPGSLYHRVLTATVARQAAPRPLPPPRAPTHLEPRKPLRPCHDDPMGAIAEQRHGCEDTFRTADCSDTTHNVSSRGNRLAARVSSLVPPPPAARHRSRSHSGRCGTNAPPNHLSSAYRPAADLILAMNAAPDRAAWTLGNCKAIMDLAGIASLVQDSYLELFREATATAPRRLPHLIRWMNRLLLTMTGNDDHPIGNMPKWFQNALSEWTTGGLGATAR